VTKTNTQYTLVPGAEKPLKEVLRDIGSAFQAQAISDYDYQMNNESAIGRMWGEQLATGLEIICWEGQLLRPLKIKRLAESSSPMWAIQLTNSPPRLKTDEQKPIEKGSRENNGDENKVRSPDVGALAYLYNHHLVLEQFYQNTGPTQMMLIRLKPSVWEEILTQPSAAVTTFIQSEQPQFYGLSFTPSMLSSFNKLMSQKPCSEHQSWKSLVRTLNICSEIFDRFNQRQQKPYKGLRSKDADLLYKAHNLLLANIQTPLAIEDICKQVGLGEDKFRLLFKQVYDATPYQYFQQHRMKEARQLITTGKYSITDVGFMVGYSNMGHFAQAFKKQFGYLPKDARFNKN